MKPNSNKSRKNLQKMKKEKKKSKLKILNHKFSIYPPKKEKVKYFIVTFATKHP